MPVAKRIWLTTPETDEVSSIVRSAPVIIHTTVNDAVMHELANGAIS